MANVKINVLRAFRFTTPADRKAGVPLPVEKVFTLGEHEIDEAMLAHPWMAAGADGCIESPTQAKERKRIADEKALEAKIINENALAQAQMAEERQKRQQPQRAAADAEMESDLNTPVGVLRARQARAAGKSAQT